MNELVERGHTTVASRKSKNVNNWICASSKYKVKKPFYDNNYWPRERLKIARSKIILREMKGRGVEYHKQVQKNRYSYYHMFKKNQHVSP